MAKKPPIWQLPALIAGGMAALTAVGGGIVMASKYIQLPERVEAGEQKNAQQDKQIDRLITLQEYYARQEQQRQAPSVPQELREYDSETGITWCCPTDDWQGCFDTNAWRVCE